MATNINLAKILSQQRCLLWKDREDTIGFLVRVMDVGSSCSYNQQEDRIIEPGLTHVKIYRKKKNILPNVFGSQNHYKKEPIIDEHEGGLPPYVIVVHGPPKVGKSLLIKCLVEYYKSDDHPNDYVIVLANRRRIQFVECPNNVNGMIDAGKYADAVIFVIDARYGFEMETFEFLNILQVHGTVEVMGVLTYVDGIASDEIRTKSKQRLVENFHSEIYEAAEVFCLPFAAKMYSEKEIGKVASFISDMKFHRLSWRTTQPYVLSIDYKDVTPRDEVQKDVKCDRDVVLEGYLRGCNNMKKGTKVHIAGVGDFPLFEVTSSSDPFPLPDSRSKEKNEMEGLRTGTYIKLEVRGVPYEMIENSCRPILVGGISIEEEKAGCMEAKLMRHSWNRKLLMTRDPIIVSIGWRRYNTIPIYASDVYSGGRHQMLEYTPRDEQCIAMFWGPLAPPCTGVVFVQSMAVHGAAFRILATGVVHDNDQSEELIGASCKKKIEKWKQVEVPRVFNQLMTTPKPRDRIWQHYGPADRLSERPESTSKRFDYMRAKGAPKLSVEEREAILNKLQERQKPFMRNYCGAWRRQTLEEQRAVLFVDGEPRVETSRTPQFPHILPHMNLMADLLISSFDDVVVLIQMVKLLQF